MYRGATYDGNYMKILTFVAGQLDYTKVLCSKLAIIIVVTKRKIDRHNSKICDRYQAKKIYLLYLPEKRLDAHSSTIACKLNTNNLIAVIRTLSNKL